MIKLTPEKLINISEGFDRVGTTVKIKGVEEKIFRIINNPYKAFFETIFSNNKLEPFFKKFLVPTKISQEYLGQNGEIVLEHERIRDINFLFEWSREMTKDAGIFLIDVTIAMIKEGLYLKDSHAFNITFSNKKPIFFDYGSIVENPKKIGFVWISHFFHNFLFPVAYFSVSEGSKYRNFAIQHLDKPFNSLRFLYFTFLKNPLHTINVLFHYLSFVVQCRYVKTVEQQLKILLNLRGYLFNLEIAYPKTRWSDYYENQKHNFGDKNLWDSKMFQVEQLSKRISPASILDIGGNTGLYSEVIRQAQPKLAHLILTDYDEVAIDFAYRDPLLNHNPYVTDFHNLIRDTIVYWRPPKQTIYPSFSTRNTADLAIMLALIHHLTYFQHTSFQDIVKVLHKVSKKWIIVEFISNNDFHVQKWFRTKNIKPITNYTLENFIHELQKYFRIIDSVPCGKEREDRTLILCEK